MSYANIPNSISLQESLFGAMHSGSSDGPTIVASSPARALASLTARQAKEKDLLTSGTFGRRTFTSSTHCRDIESFERSRSLASRFHQLTSCLGSTLFRMTWKVSVTPSGRSIFRLAALGHRRSETDCTSWPTPQVHQGPNNSEDRGKDHGGKRARKTPQNVKDLLAAWPTAKSSTGDYHYDGGDREKIRWNLSGVAKMAVWATPTCPAPNPPMPRKQSPESIKTRPDLGDEEWLVWISAQPENKGIYVREMYRKMLEWCMKKGITPTRRRLLRWLDTEREAVPVTYTPPYFEEPGTARVADQEPETPKLPDCKVCDNERFVKAVINPDAEFEWARTGMVPCTACDPDAQ
jgi:hypothetical protein